MQVIRMGYSAHLGAHSCARQPVGGFQWFNFAVYLRLYGF